MKKRSDNRKPDRRTATTGKRSRRPATDEILPEYPGALIREGQRGKYAARYRQGTNLILLDADVAAEFPDSSSVNAALRTLVNASGSKKLRGRQ